MYIDVVLWLRFHIEHSSTPEASLLWMWTFDEAGAKLGLFGRD